jgi:hypothetical protein
MFSLNGDFSGVESLGVLRAMRGVCAMALLVGSASFAHAKDTAKTKADPYAAIGINAGGLRLYPVLEIDGVTTSNVRKASTAAKADAGLELKPSLSFASDWSRHRWAGSANADWLRYGHADDLSTLSGSAQTALRLDIRRITRADFSAGYTLGQTGVENSQVPASAAKPRRDHNFVTRAGITHDFGGLEGSATLGLSRSIFEDVALVGGGAENNSDRNLWEPSLALRGALGGAGAPLRSFVEFTYDPRIHDQTFDRNGLKRDSQGGSLAVGLSFDSDAIWNGEVALTQLLRHYDDPALGTARATGVTGRLMWLPTEITSIEGTSSVALDDTVSAGVAATRTWMVGLNLTHALRDNLNVLAGTSLSIQDVGASFDTTVSTKLGLDWQVNPNMAAGVTYQGKWFNAGAGGGDYDEQRLMTSVILKR